jgi:hypothetical protein
MRKKKINRAFEAGILSLQGSVTVFPSGTKFAGHVTNQPWRRSVWIKRYWILSTPEGGWQMSSRQNNALLSSAFRF